MDLGGIQCGKNGGTIEGIDVDDSVKVNYEKV